MTHCKISDDESKSPSLAGLHDVQCAHLFHNECFSHQLSHIEKQATPEKEPTSFDFFPHAQEIGIQQVGCWRIPFILFNWKALLGLIMKQMNKCVNECI